MIVSCDTSAETRKVLIFSCDRRRMGTYADSVSAVIDAGTAQRRGMRLAPLAELLGIAHGNEAQPDLRWRNVLIIRDAEPGRGILIDALEEIAEVAPSDILPLPRSIAQSDGMAPYIGGMVRDNEIILMLDMQKIASIKETS